MNWIPVSERLPDDNGQDVLVYGISYPDDEEADSGGEEENFYEATWYSGMNAPDCWGLNQDYYKVVTHWIPLEAP